MGGDGNLFREAGKNAEKRCVHEGCELVRGTRKGDLAEVRRFDRAFSRLWGRWMMPRCRREKESGESGSRPLSLFESSSGQNLHAHMAYM